MSEPTDEMVEAAARAIAKSVGLQPNDCASGNFSVGADGKSSSRCHLRVWELYRCHARAALNAVLPGVVAEERARIVEFVQQMALANGGTTAPETHVAAAIQRMNRESMEKRKRDLHRRKGDTHG